MLPRFSWPPSGWFQSWLMLILFLMHKLIWFHKNLLFKDYPWAYIKDKSLYINKSWCLYRCMHTYVIWINRHWQIYYSLGHPNNYLIFYFFPKLGVDIFLIILSRPLRIINIHNRGDPFVPSIFVIGWNNGLHWKSSS